MGLRWIIPFFIVLAVAIVFLFASYTAVRLGWLNKLKKPEAYYDNWVYTPIWYLIYGLIIYSWIRLTSEEVETKRIRMHCSKEVEVGGIFTKATVLSCRLTGGIARNLIFFTLYILQLILLSTWMILFFYIRNMNIALIFLIMSILVLLVIIVFSLIDPPSLMMNTVYLAWLLYVLYVSWRLSALN